MQPLSSVAAFVARYAVEHVGDESSGAAAEAAEILDTLDPEARMAVEAQRHPPAERLAWLRRRSGRAWSTAWLAHVEQRAFTEIRRELQRRGCWRG